MIAIIDGYNVIHRVPALRVNLERSLEAGRAGLIRCCQEWLTSRRDITQFWIVFDGAVSPGGESPSGASGVRVMFSGKGETADERILAVMNEVGRYSEYVAVSDDNEVVRNSRALNARTLTSAEFFGTARRKGNRARAAGAGTESDAKLSEHEQRMVNESLKREWGIE